MEILVAVLIIIAIFIAVCLDNQTHWVCICLAASLSMFAYCYLSPWVEYTREAIVIGDYSNEQIKVTIKNSLRIREVTTTKSCLVYKSIRYELSIPTAEELNGKNN